MTEENNMDLKDMESVVALVEQGSYVKAAEVLFISQPALSRKITALENELKVRLFERSSHGIKATGAGQRFYSDAKALLSLRDNLERDMKDERQRLNTLLLIYSANGHVPFAAEMIRKARQVCPSIKLIANTHFEMIQQIGRPLQIQELLFLNYCELLFLSEQEYTEDIRQYADSLLLEPGGLCAFVRSDHLLANRKTIAIDELQDQQLLLPSDVFAPTLIHAMNSALGYPEKTVAATSPTDFRMKVISENLIGIMPWSSRNIQDEYMRCLPIREITKGFGLQLVWRKEKKSDALNLFLKNIIPLYQK